MMKKLIIVLLISCSFTLFLPSVSAKGTLRDLRNELQSLINQKAANDAAQAKTKNQIAQENTNIANANAAVEQARSDIEVAKEKINETNDNINKVKDESEKLLVFYQMTTGDSTFMDYMSSSSSMTDLIMRSEAVNQVLDYNRGKLTELEDLIIQNEDLQVELKKKEKDLQAKIVTYEQSITKLEGDLTSLVEVVPEMNEQIRMQRELIKLYEDIGCKEDEDVEACLANYYGTGDTAKWMKPTQRGYISSGFGYRSFLLNGRPYSDYHPAVDVAGNAMGTPIYAVANGYVAAVINKASCGGNQVYLHVRVQGVKYTITYAHMLSINVKVGDKVNQSTVIGTVGGGGSTLKANGGWDTCSTGAHLHFGVTQGYYLSKCADCYSNYNTYIAKSIVPPMMPKYGQWYYSR